MDVSLVRLCYWSGAGVTVLLKKRLSVLNGRTVSGCVIETAEGTARCDKME